MFVSSSKDNAFLFICKCIHMSISEVWSTFQYSLSDAIHGVLFLNVGHSPYSDAVNILSIISANIQNRFQICKRARTVSYLVWYGWRQRMKFFDLLYKHVFAEARCQPTTTCFPPVGMWPWFALRSFFFLSNTCNVSSKGFLVRYPSSTLFAKYRTQFWI